MSAVQRFCPVCDRLFLDSEAVLACQDCSVLHHPACWIRNQGCASAPDHSSAPVPQAYGLTPSVYAPPHAGEGTRSVLPRPASTEPRTSMIGEDTPPSAFRQGTSAAPSTPPKLASPPPEPPGSTIRHGRYVPPDEELTTPHRVMPKIYGGHGWLRFWYVPAGAAVAVLAALGTFWAISALTGGGDDDEADGNGDFVATATPSPETATIPATSTPTTPVASPGATETTIVPATATFAPTTGKFLIGEPLEVTGAGDCLNVRVGPARSNDAIVCLDDGDLVTVTGGPTASDTFVWWKVSTRLGEGWAVEDFLKKPD